MRVFSCPYCGDKDKKSSEYIEFDSMLCYPCDYCDDEGRVGLRKIVGWFVKEVVYYLKNKEQQED